MPEARPALPVKLALGQRLGSIGNHGGMGRLALSVKLTPAGGEPIMTTADVCIAVSVAVMGTVTVFGTPASLIDVLALAINVVVLRWARRNSELWRFSILTTLWALAIVVSDQVHNVPFGTTVPTLLFPIVLAITAMTLAWLGRHSLRRLHWVMLGAIASHLIYVLVHGTTYFTSNPWKFGLALPVTLLGLALVTLFGRGRTLLSIGVLSASAVYSALHDYRSMTGITVAAIVLTLALKRKPRPSRNVPVLKLFVGLLVIVWGSYVGYGLVAAAGWLPYESAAKYQVQAKQGNLLVAARPEIVGSVNAVASSPIIGLGTNGELEPEVLSRAQQTLMEAGAVLADSEQKRLFGNGVNSHSLLFQSAVGAGIIGALPWAYAVYLGMRAMVQRRPGARLMPLTVFWALASAWDILFSPNQPHIHLLVAGFIALVTWKGPSLPQIEGVAVIEQARDRARPRASLG